MLPDTSNPKRSLSDMGASLVKISQRSSPIILIGMHRSGTTLLTRLLSEMGAEMGQSLDRHREALCFQSINDTLLRTSRASWLNPDPFVSQLSTPDFVSQMTELAERMLANEIETFGRIGPEQLWGWKDPRTTLTLPIWLCLFPEAKVVHLIRNGIDVALSLERRAWRNYLRPRHNDIERLFPLGSFIKGYRLWATYLKCAASYSQPHHYQMRYENLVSHPMGELAALANFLGTSIDQYGLYEVASTIRKPRERSRFEALWVGWLFSLTILDSSPLNRWGYVASN